MSDFDSIREEGERISREEGYKVLLAEIVARDQEIERLRLAIRRLAEQDATLSVVGGNVIVEMDATLTAEEREAIEGVREQQTKLPVTLSDENGRDHQRRGGDDD